MRTAARPLNESACRAADDEFYAAHSDMVKDGRRVPLDPSDPHQASLRKEWMDLYEKHGGPVEDDEEKRSRRAPGGSEFGDSKAPGDPVQPCPLACAIVEATVECSHGRRSSNGLLEVVPVELGDKISLVAKAKNKCGDHPEWTVSGFTDSTHTGSSHSFSAQAWRINKPLNWLLNVSPHVYEVAVSSCSGSETVQVRAYPSDKLSVSFGGERWSDALKKLEEFVETVMKRLVKEPEFKLLRGSVSLSAQWKEYEKDYRAFYQYDVQVGLNPFIEAGGKWTIGPAAVIPPDWREYIGDAGLTLKLSGGIEVNGHWQRTAPEQAKALADARGYLGLSLGAELYLVSKKVLNSEVSGSSGISLDAEDAKKDMPTIKAQFKWDGLKGVISLKVAGIGWLSFQKEHTFIEEAELGGPMYIPVVSDSQGEL